MAVCQKLEAKVEKAFDNSRCLNGSRRIPKELAENSVTHNIKTIVSGMKREDLRAKAARKFKCTSDGKHNMPSAPTSIVQDFNAVNPNKKSVGDIKYLA